MRLPLPLLLVCLHFHSVAKRRNLLLPLLLLLLVVIPEGNLRFPSRRTELPF